ncbi:MAG: NAD-dependent epimerase/dehydratase family protein [Chloroflexi bacterium]|nr:MAG: NAD-dependent epimerase/dehydratase family protein [Chloroflexota bacterium]MBL1195355.1 NAD-dependent epimerase/dehydratase family protein [Chloroflexota bacterium]NOH12639.1 NAD(P)H-binding protein [Chloroflexota bacterium]
MTAKKLDAVTGAFGYTGKYITTNLLSRGRDVITLTSKPVSTSPFGERVQPYPFSFDQPDLLATNLKGVDTLYNTYWVRFNHGSTTFQQAVDNTRTLINAAVEAGVRRFVHVSIANPSLDSPLPYYKGKAELEESIKSSGLSYAILRPTVVFGREDILINNIAWLLRRFPLFAVPGDGEYKLKPIYVEDLAGLAVEAGAGDENQIIDAVGPEIYTFNELAELLKSAVGSRSRLVCLPPMLAWRLSQILGALVGDNMLTREEVLGLMDNLLVSGQMPTGSTLLSTWVRDNVDTLGAKYANELARHFIG